MAQDDLLSELQRRAAIYKAAGKPNTEIAETLGVSISTLHRWNKNPDFKRMVADLLDEEHFAWKTQALKEATKAIATLVEVMDEGSFRDKVAAAKELLAIVERSAQGLEVKEEVENKEIPKGISDQTAKEIRTKILGINQ